jgi:type II secretory pathway pseudopilin PulG
MTRVVENRQSGLTMIEGAILLLIIGMIIAFATPKITTSMREYRLTNAARQITDPAHRAKTQAASENRRVTLRADTANSRAGIVIYDSGGAEVRTEHVPLPHGISFALPANVTAPVTGAPASASVSFPALTGSTAIFQQDFNSRLHFPRHVLQPGAAARRRKSHYNVGEYARADCHIMVPRQ